jgi:two-component system, OmpR family, response regulator
VAPLRRSIAVPRLLVADDEANIREVACYALRRDGFEVEEAPDGAAALQRIERGGIDLLVLDVLMPALDGLALCRQLRRPGAPALPIIFLSSRTEEADRVLGLELGGDDYLTKPFSPRELAARVRSVLRRAAAPDAIAAPAPLCRGRLRIDRANGEAFVDGDRRVALTLTELRLLAALIEHPGRVLTRAQLIARAYEGEHHVTERTVDSHLKRVRAKLAAHGVEAVETVHGLGYRAL